MRGHMRSPATLFLSTDGSHLLHTSLTLPSACLVLQVLRMEHCHIQGAWELHLADSHTQQPRHQPPHNSNTHHSQHSQTHHHHHHDHDSHYSGSERGHHTFSHRDSRTQGLPLQQLHLGGCSLGPAAATGREEDGGGGGNGAVHRLLRACARSLRMADLQGE